MNRILLLALVLALSACGRPHFGSVSALEAASTGSGISDAGGGPPAPSRAGTTVGSDTTPGAGTGGAAGGSGVTGTTGGNPSIDVFSDGPIKRLTLCFSKTVEVPTGNTRGGTNSFLGEVSILDLDLNTGILKITVDAKGVDPDELSLKGINQPIFTLTGLGCATSAAATVTNLHGSYSTADGLLRSAGPDIKFQVAEGNFPAPGSSKVDFLINFKPALDRLGLVGTSAAGKGTAADQIVNAIGTPPNIPYQLP